MPNLSSLKQNLPETDGNDPLVRGADVPVVGSSIIPSTEPVQMNESLIGPRQGKKAWSLGTKARLTALIMSVVPVLVVSLATYIPIQRHLVQAKQGGEPELTEAQDFLATKLPFLLVATVLSAGGISLILTNRFVRSVLKAAAASNTVVNRLQREDISLQDRTIGEDELSALAKNTQLIEDQLPTLLTAVETHAEESKILINFTRRLRESHSEEEVLRLAVDEIRNVFKADRVALFRFDSAEDGTIVEESVAHGWPKMLWTTLADPCLADYLEQYRQGRIRAIDDIHNAGLNDCHIGLLDRFAVKANLIAPILKSDRLFGLLIANQCSGPRVWQSSDIALIAQLAAQVSFALDHTRVLEEIDARAAQAQILIEMTRRIRASLDEDNILQTVVEQVRKVLRADRVVVYPFNQGGGGFVAAESVLPGWPHALDYKIEDACIPEDIRAAYLKGRVVPTTNVVEAGFHPDHYQLMAQLQIQANLVAPILNNDHLFGLLIAHQCSGPREWSPPEIDLFTQLATQVGYALDHARLLGHVEHNYQTAEVTSHTERQYKEALQQQITTAVAESEQMLKYLSTQTSDPLESITATYTHVKTISGSTQNMQGLLQHLEQQQLQPIRHLCQTGMEEINQLQIRLTELREAVFEVGTKTHPLSEKSKSLLQVLQQMTHLLSQLKLQGMNLVLSGTRNGEESQTFPDFAAKVFELSQQLEKDLAEFQPLILSIQAQASSTSLTIEASHQTFNSGTSMLADLQQLLDQVINNLDQMANLVDVLKIATTEQVQNSALANQTILEVANSNRQVAEQMATFSNVFSHLIATFKDGSHP
ncbi:MAG: GAF domain-containing protein [Thermosynechococcaceae cyanobacterium]